MASLLLGHYFYTSSERISFEASMAAMINIRGYYIHHDGSTASVPLTKTFVHSTRLTKHL